MMGRLFWKFFFMFWLAQFLTMVGVGISVWALRPDFSPPSMSEMHRLPQEPSGGFREMPHPSDLQNGMPPRPLDGPHQELLPPLLPIAAGSLVSLIFAALLAWYFARPIRTLRKAFDDVAKGKFDTRIGASIGGGKDELADLGSDFDHMASRLQGLMDAQRRLLHDISHELRSPLARLQAATDLMQQQPERAAEFITRLERDTGRIDALVGELLTLARLDSGMAEGMGGDVDLREILEHIVSDARFEAGSRQCTVEVVMPEQMHVKGNAELIFRALENVVRNAVLHAPANTLVEIAVRNVEGGRWQIKVADQGRGVPPSDLDAIFQPFFRSSTNGDTAGYGLGLAITQRVVIAHGGKVRAVNRASGGLQVEIILPAA